MATFVLFTHTQWAEAPRIRHQTATLLLNAGHTVYFFERASYPWRKGAPATVEVQDRLTLVHTKKLMHHQLRAFTWLHWINDRFVAGSIKRRLRECGIGPDAVIINFAHDFHFLKRLMPKSRVITIIHDDFEAQARLPFHHHITWSLRRTCQESDEVFAVSTPLQERLREWCDPKLLLPWSVVPYRAPHTQTARRNILLFWGYVDTAIDLNIVRLVSQHVARTRPDWKIQLVGPTQGTDKPRLRIAAELADCANVSIHPKCNLDDLPLDSVIGALLPYRRSRAVDSVTLANKSLQLLARGLPLLISGVPAFIQRPFIERLDGASGVEHALASCVANFNAWQPAIRQFVEENSPESRLRLLGIVPSSTAPTSAAPTTASRAPKS